MSDLTICFPGEATDGCCCLCDGPVAGAAGPRLCRTDDLAPVCHDCGKRHAPSLAALLHLARTAAHVGRIGRHTVVPPMTSLLALAHAAEAYLSTQAAPRRAA